MASSLHTRIPSILDEFIKNDDGTYVDTTELDEAIFDLIKFYKKK